MYAIVKTGGKQYRVSQNDVIKVEKLPGEQGETVTLDQVLMVGDDSGSTVGAPMVEGASVTAQVLDQRKADKVVIFKKKRRQGYRRTKGHRQEITVLRVQDIVRPGA